MRIHFIFLLSLMVVVAGCQNPNMSSRPADGQFDRPQQTSRLEPQTIGTVSGKEQPSIMGEQYAPKPAIGKVAILLPLTGPQKSIGQSLLQAAQLAVFDMNEPAFELLPIDTNGTPQGASAAVEQAATQGVKLILGPLLANNVSAAGTKAQQYNLNVIGFTTDWTKAGNNVMTIGILPFDQGTRLAMHAVKTGKKHIAIVNDNGAYANAVISAFKQAARSYGLTITAQATPETIANLGTQRGTFDAILMPINQNKAAAIAPQLSSIGLGADQVLWMGTGMWDDNKIKMNALMANAIYAAPAPQPRQNFERSYQSLYGDKPPRLSSLAYDATALSIVLLKQNHIIQPQAITNPNGFAGIDGIFRFQSNGLAQRGLAIHRITGRGTSIVIDQAPNSF